MRVDANMRSSSSGLSDACRRGRIFCEDLTGCNGTSIVCCGDSRSIECERLQLDRARYIVGVVGLPLDALLCVSGLPLWGSVIRLMFYYV